MKGLITPLALIALMALSGCELTEEEKEQLDRAAVDLEQLADQIIITYPAKNSEIDQSIVTVRADIPTNAQATEVALYLDGIEIAKDTDGAPWEIQWPAYYSADGKPHTLLLKTITGSGNEVRNNESFQLTVSTDANQALAFSEGVEGAKLQDQNQLEVSFSEFPGATRYQVTDGTQIFEAASTTATLTDLDVGSYGLKYRAIFDYSDSTTLTGPWSEPALVELLAPKLPVIHDPVVAKKDDGYEVTFSWDQVSEGDSYSLLLGEKDSVLTEAGLKSGNTILHGPLALGEYQWQLQRTNVLGQTSHSEKADLGVGVFTTQLGGSGNDSASQIIKSQSGGYLVRAVTSSYEVAGNLLGTYDDWIIRLDDGGEIVGQYVENKSGYARFTNMIEASDGSIYLVGRDWESSKAIIVKLDSNLNPVWENEVIYRPSNVSERYDFEAAVEWNGKLYVSATGGYLHEVDMVSGSVSSAISLPEISGVKLFSIKAMLTKKDGTLAVIGYGEADPKPEFILKQGAIVITLDSELNAISTWNNVGDYLHMNIADGIELGSNRTAVIGQAETGGVAISSINSDGSMHRNYYSSYSDEIHYGASNLEKTSDGDLLVFIQQYISGSYSLLLKSFNENLTPSVTKQLNISGNVSARGVTVNDDDSITLMYVHKQNFNDDWDVVIQRIPPIN